MAVFINPDIDPQGYGYQLKQSQLAVGSGGITGYGLWMSRQKYQYLPEASADTIFAIFAEETGFIGALVLVALILIIVWRGLKISKGCNDYYGSLLVAGVMIWFGWQSFMNIGATVGAMPLTGVPLPFVSHGGSALAMALAASGMVLAVSKYSKYN
jgi:cell division protein FtsW